MLCLFLVYKEQNHYELIGGGPMTGLRGEGSKYRNESRSSLGSLLLECIYTYMSLHTSDISLIDGAVEIYGTGW